MNDQIEKRLESIISGCKVCNGSGIIPKETDGGLYLDDCVCTKEVTEKLKFVKANIQDQYWGFDLDKLSGQFVKKNKVTLKKVFEYVDNLHDNIKEGRGIWFASTPGLGKSIISACILKKAVDLGYNAYSERASTIVSLKFKALNDREAYNLINYIVRQVDILAIEEIEKVYLSDDDDAMNNQLFYEFMSIIYDSKKSLLISSNKTQSEVTKRYPTYVRDRLRLIDKITFKGMSERAKLG